MSGTAPAPETFAAEPPAANDDLARLRLAFVAGTLGNGGAERQLAYLVERLRDRVAALTVFSLTEGEVWEERLRRRGVAVETFGRSRSKLRRLAELRRRLRRFEPHLVHCQHSFANPYAVAAGRSVGAATVASVRGDVERALADTVRWIGVTSLRRADRVVANSAPAVAQLEALGIASEKLALLPNSVDTERFAPRKRSAAEASDPLVLGLVGRLERVKRPDRFLDAIASLRQRDLPVRGVIAGGGRLADSLAGAIDERDLADRVELRGEVEDVAALYHELDLLVLTSEHEGSPNVVLEAMASGLPVIAFGVGEVPRLLGHCPGAIVPEGDVDRLVERIGHLVGNAEERRRLGRENRRAAHAEYGPGRLDAALTALYAPFLAPCTEDARDRPIQPKASDEIPAGEGVSRR